MISILLNPWNDVIPTEYQRNVFLKIYTCKAMGSIKYSARGANIETDAT